MKKILLLSSIVIYFSAIAQDETIKKLKAESDKPIKKDLKDTSEKAWKKGGLFNLNLSQGSLSNWAAGGDKFSL
jgi:hypothetical protein